MPTIILQPCSSKSALDHFRDTIKAPVPLTMLERFLTKAQLADVQQIYPEGLVPTWGVTPGNKNVNVGKWAGIKPGDVTLFSGAGCIFGSGVVTTKLHNAALANELWKQDAVGQTWEYVYFLDEIKTQDISYEQFNQAVGYAPNFVIQGFNLLSLDKSQKVLSAFDLESEVILPPVTPEEFKAAVLGSGNSAVGSTPGGSAGSGKVTLPSLGPSGSLDIPSAGVGRIEQAFLRRQMFGKNKDGTCTLCGEVFPVQFLVTAHIKARAKCTDDERLDYKHIVAPMCKFGCDDLYEKGYVSIQGGTIVPITGKHVTPGVQERLGKIVGRTCSHWKPETSDYFDWHLQKWSPK